MMNIYKGLYHYLQGYYARSKNDEFPMMRRYLIENRINLLNELMQWEFDSVTKSNNK